MSDRSGEKHAKSNMPQKIEVLLCHGKDLRNPVSGLAEIVLSGKSYYLKMPPHALSGKRSSPGEVAAEILRAHVLATALASEHLSAGTVAEQMTLALKCHVAQQLKSCSCGQQGFKKMSFGAIDCYGSVTIEYECIYCGTTDNFTIDHSNLLG